MKPVPRLRYRDIYTSNKKFAANFVILPRNSQRNSQFDREIFCEINDLIEKFSAKSYYSSNRNTAKFRIFCMC